MSIRPSSSTGVLFALVYNNTVPLSVSVLTQGEEDAVSSNPLLERFSTSIYVQHMHTYASTNTCLNHTMLSLFRLQNLQVFLDGVSIATLESLMLCYPDRLTVELNVTPTAIQISGNSSTVHYMESNALREALDRLNNTMQNPITTYIGGIPG